MSNSAYTINDVMERWREIERVEPPPIPPFAPDPAATNQAVFAVASMRQHMTDEGWQLQAGLGGAGYRLVGVGLDVNTTDVRRACEEIGSLRTVVVQDKREWDRGNSACFNPSEHFEGIEYLAERPDVFKLTVIKDAHHDHAYHRDAAAEMGCHAWIHYYHPRIVCGLATWLRPQHLIRTWHSIDAFAVPEYTPAGRFGALLSGAVIGRYYPLRAKLKRGWQHLPHTRVLLHPGYGADGSKSESYLRILSRYRVAICTASVFGYSLRKIIEATACGCVVITDLPADDVLPEIDGNLVRVHPDISLYDMAGLIENCLDGYDAERQHEFARRAKLFYDWRRRGLELAQAIERVRNNYHAV